MAKKCFHLRTVLSVTTGRLLTESESPNDNGIGKMYALLGHMTGDSPFTHQLGRFAEECKPWLFRWFPELATANACLDKLDEWIKKDKTGTNEEGIKIWLTELKMLDPRIQDVYEIGQIPMDDHDRKEPYKERKIMERLMSKVVTFCDVCGKEIPYPNNKCKICGNVMCYDCGKDNMKTFFHAVSFSGSDDGDYCTECLCNPIPPEHVELIEAYKVIESLRAEYKAWNKDFETRHKTAEAKVKALLSN